MDDIPEELKRDHQDFFIQHARLRAVKYDEVAILPKFQERDEVSTKARIAALLTSKLPGLPGLPMAKS